MSNVTIRPARLEDAAGIAAVLRDLGWFDHIAGEPPAATESRVAEQLARCQADSSHSVYVAADPAAGQIAGRALLAAVAAEGTRRGATRLMLFNRKMRESYQRGFYPKAGWYERDDVAFFMYDLPESE